MNFPQKLFEITMDLLVIYLLSACYLFYLIKKNFPDFWNKSYPYGFMMIKAGYVHLFSTRAFQITFTTLKGHAQMMQVLFTSRFSDNRKIGLVKNIARLLLACYLISFIYLIFIIGTSM